MIFLNILMLIFSKYLFTKAIILQIIVLVVNNIRQKKVFNKGLNKIKQS